MLTSTEKTIDLQSATGSLKNSDRRNDTQKAVIGQKINAPVSVGLNQFSSQKNTTATTLDRNSSMIDTSEMCLPAGSITTENLSAGIGSKLHLRRNMWRYVQFWDSS